MSSLRQLVDFPSDFSFGVATSSYQIEGSQFGGCGLSHWDTFCTQKGRILDGSSGARGCEHYLRWEEDLDLVQTAGFDAYRFSFSWPRLLPNSQHQINPEGLAFYDRLIDGMLARGLKPFATLYHWDLPTRLADKGGWRSRETAEQFADYATQVIRHFGDRLETVAPINEPWCVAWLSHYLGQHAPGMTDLEATAKSMHYIQLAHGLAIGAMRAEGQGRLGAVVNKEFAHPADDSTLAKEKADLYDSIYNRWFDQSLFKGTYPEPVLSLFEAHMPDQYEQDLKVINAPLDWVGINYYTRAVIQANPNEPHVGFDCIRGELPKTDMGWEVYPEGLSVFLRRMAEEYCPSLPLYVTENGMANADYCIDGDVKDLDRIDYHASHLNEVKQLLEQGLPIKGYFAWSLLDNFEWSFGYQKRFGLVHVDYNSYKRTPKRSYLAFKEALSARR